MVKIGKKNALTDIKGILVGQYTDTDAVCGVTVVICPEGAVAGVDVRGSAPGTRETDLLSPLNLVDKVQAVVLSGGSVFGLAAADGAVRWLADHGIGFPLEKDQWCNKLLLCESNPKAGSFCSAFFIRRVHS